MPVLASLVLFLVNQNVCRSGFNRLCKIIHTLAVFHSFAFFSLLFIFFLSVGDAGGQSETVTGKALKVLCRVIP